MRRHEAIEHLKEIQKGWVVADPFYAAIDIAIEALTALDLVDEQSRTEAYRSGYIKGWLDRARRD